MMSRAKLGIADGKIRRRFYEYLNIFNITLTPSRNLHNYCIINIVSHLEYSITTFLLPNTDLLLLSLGSLSDNLNVEGHEDGRSEESCSLDWCIVGRFPQDKKRVTGMGSYGLA